MADPTTPTTPAAQTVLPDITDVQASTAANNIYNQSIDDTNKGISDLSVSSLNYNSIMKITADTLGSATSQADKFGNFLAGLTKKVDVNGASFGLMSAAMIKTTEAFRGLGNVDTGRISNFTSQYTKLFEIIQNSPGTQAAKGAIDLITSGMDKAGATATQKQAALTEFKKGITGIATSFLMGADNTLNYQNALIQTAAAQGGMHDLLLQTGQGFQHLNDVTKKHIEIVGSAAEATNLMPNALEKYMSVLKDLPGGMLNFGKSVEVGTQKSSLLTATIQYATGAGRDYGEVIKDMSIAMNDYGMGHENALKFSARMSETSETLGARTEDVTAAIRTAADSFKSFVFGGANANDMTKGMSDSMESYVANLKSVGVPAKNAIAMFSSYTDNMKNMSDGQRAFLSESTGGPGGLMGAFQMEKLMTTDHKAYQAKMTEAFKKMAGGPLVSHEQAESSQGAAVQYKKQMQLLQGGALGSQYKDRGQAEAALEAMKKGTGLAGVAQGRTEDETIRAGRNIEDLSRTKISKMDIQAESVMLSGGVNNLKTMEDTMSAAKASGGSDTKGRGTNPIDKAELQSWGEEASRRLSGHAENPIAQLLKTTSGLPSSAVNSVSSLMQQFTSGKISDKEMRARSQADLSKISTTSKDKNEVNEANNALRIINSTSGDQFQSAKKELNNSKKVFRPGQYFTAGSQVGQSVNQPGNQSGNESGNESGGPGTAKANGSAIPVTLTGGSITVNFTGKCPHCGTNINSSEHAAVNSPASTKTM